MPGDSENWFYILFNIYIWTVDKHLFQHIGYI